MKLKTSYFNGKVLRKDITRFSPVWALYCVFWILVLMMLQISSNPGVIANDIVEIFSMMVWINLIYGFICAGVLFGDLFNSRMCNALHAMPMRREGWFLTHLAAGMLFSLVPNGMFTLVTAIMIEQYFYIALIWLAVMMLQFLFFFGLGVFCAMCAGNRLAMAGLYGIINFLGIIVLWLTTMLYEPLMYGVAINDDILSFICPAVQMTPASYVDFSYGKVHNVWGGFIAAEWQYLFGVAGVGVVLLGLALLVYRRRKLESAGDFISLRPCAPVFLVVSSLVAGAVFYALAEAFDAAVPYFFLVFGVTVGFFIAKMLLDRTVKVFRGKVFLGLGILIASLLGSLLLTWLDPLGFITYIPATNQVERVSFLSSSDRYFYLRDDFGYTEEEDIDAIRDLHELLLNERHDDSGEIANVYIAYELKSGITVTRQYGISDVSSPAGQAARKQLSRLEYLLRTDDVDAFTDRIQRVEFHMYSDDSYVLFTGKDQIQQLMETLEKDSLEGNLAQDWMFHPYSNTFGWITFTLENENDSDPGQSNKDKRFTYLDFAVYSNFSNTVQFIKGLA